MSDKEVQPSENSELKRTVQPPSAWEKVKTAVIDGIRHTKHGCVHFYRDARIAQSIFWKGYVKRYELTREEKRKLKSALADIFRMVPFSFFIIVPLAELLLPVYLWVFPNMLPSQFQTANQKLSMKNTKLVAKTEMTKFLLETLDFQIHEVQKGLERNELQKSASAVDKFVEKYKKNELIVLSDEEIKAFKILFEEELSLSKLPRVHLVYLCKIAGVGHVGPDGWLRMMLRNHLKNLRTEDRELYAEGVTNLSVCDLTEACHERGIHTEGVPIGEMQRRLSRWLHFSLRLELPASLLLFAHAFSMADIQDVTKQVAPVVERDILLDMDLQKDFEQRRSRTETAPKQKKVSLLENLEDIKGNTEVLAEKLESLMGDNDLTKKDRKVAERLVTRIEQGLSQIDQKLKASLPRDEQAPLPDSPPLASPLTQATPESPDPKFVKRVQ